MRGSVTWFLVFSLSLVTVGCAGEEERSITFAVGGAPRELEFWEELLDGFEQLSGIQVNILRQPTDTDLRRQGLVVPLRSGQSDPDVFLMDVAWIAQFSSSGWLEPLDTYVEERGIELDAFFRGLLSSIDLRGGQLVALPVYVDGGLLYYREDLLARYGYERPPRTWNELVEYSIHVQEQVRESNPDFYGFVWQGAQYEGLICNFIEFAVSNGGGILDDGGKFSLTIEENIGALRFMRDLIHRYRVSPPNTFTEMREEEGRIFFQQGNALFERNWPYAWALHQEDHSAVKGRVQIAPLPHFPGGKSVSTLGGWHIGISKYSRKKSISWELVEFITSYEIQKKLALGLGWNPGRMDVYGDSEVVKRFPHFTTLTEVFENAYPRPIIPYYTQLSEVMQRHINGTLAGECEPEPALSAAEREVMRLEERYGGVETWQ